MKYDRTMDIQCIPLCDALNGIKGIQTIESCCGHGITPFRIWFFAENLQVLPHVAYWFDRCHCGHNNWKIIVRTDCGKSPVKFLIEGPCGEQAFEEANHIAQLILNDN